MKLLVTIVSVVLILIIALLTVNFRPSKQLSVTISNNTNITVKNLLINYVTAKKSIKVPAIKPQKEYKVLISTEVDDSIELIYKDNSGIEHKKIILGYITKGIVGNYTVNISFNNNGKLLISS